MSLLTPRSWWARLWDYSISRWDVTGGRLTWAYPRWALAGHTVGSCRNGGIGRRQHSRQRLLKRAFRPAGKRQLIKGRQAGVGSRSIPPTQTRIAVPKQPDITSRPHRVAPGGYCDEIRLRD
jgi:hypothetical protein